MKRDFILFLAVLFLTASLMSCNMMKGAGKDVEDAGKTIQKTADQNK